MVTLNEFPADNGRHNYSNRSANTKAHGKVGMDYSISERGDLQLRRRSAIKDSANIHLSMRCGYSEGKTNA